MQDNCLGACSPNRRDTTGGVAATSQLSRRWTSACPASNIIYKRTQEQLTGQGGGAENLDIAKFGIFKIQYAFWDEASCYQLSFGTSYLTEYHRYLLEDRHWGYGQMNLV